MNNSQAMAIAKQFCEDHLSQCCAELVEMHDTGVLLDGRMHELTRLCAYAGAGAQPVAEAMVKIAAMRRVAATQTV